MVGRTPCARLLKQPRPFPSAQSYLPRNTPTSYCLTPKQYRIILSADTASEVRQMLKPKAQIILDVLSSILATQMRARSRGAVLEPLGGNYAVLP